MGTNDGHNTLRKTGKFLSFEERKFKEQQSSRAVFRSAPRGCWRKKSRKTTTLVGWLAGGDASAVSSFLVNILEKGIFTSVSRNDAKYERLHVSVRDAVL